MTHERARQAILGELRAKGWAVQAHLKTPHATSPNGRLRLYFKPQAVRYTLGARHDAGEAHALGIDLRKVDPAKFVAQVSEASTK